MTIHIISETLHKVSCLPHASTGAGCGWASRFLKRMDSRFRGNDNNVLNQTFLTSQLIAVLLGSVLFISTAVAKDSTGPAPDFTLKSISGENLKLSEFRGEVVLINFWASWCGPCRKEMPLLDQLYQKYHPMGFTILGVNVEEDSAPAMKVLKEVPVSFPILFDTSNTVSKLYNLVGMPSTMIVDRDGNIRYRHVAYLPGYEKKYEEQIKELIRE